MKYNEAAKILEKVSKDYKETDLIRDVASMIINEADGYEKIEDFFNDLLSHGCVSGMIGALIYYVDTHKFYDEHYEDIENLRIETEKDLGEPLSLKENDLKNYYAWFAFEETARIIASSKLNLDL